LAELPIPDDSMIWTLRLRRIFQLNYVAFAASSFLWLDVLFSRLSDRKSELLFVAVLACIIGIMRPGEGLGIFWLIGESTLKRTSGVVKKEN
jgi:hypothetical protein